MAFQNYFMHADSKTKNCNDFLTLFETVKGTSVLVEEQCFYEGGGQLLAQTLLREMGIEPLRIRGLK